MAINVNDNIYINAGKPVEPKSLSSSIAPYADVATALANIPLAVRYLTLTVQIAGTPPTEYWFANGVSDSDLVVKTSTGGGSSNGTNGLSNIGSNIGLGGQLSKNTTITGNGHDINLGMNADGSIGGSAPLGYFNVISSEGMGFENNTVTGYTNTLALNESLVYLGNSKGAYNTVLESNDQFIFLYAQNSTAGYGTSITLSNDKLGVAKIQVQGTTPNFAGMQYSADYSSHYSSRSLVDKTYVDNKVSAISSIPNNDFVFGKGTTIGAPNSTYTGNDNVLVIMSQTPPTITGGANSINNMFVFGEAMTLNGAPTNGGTITDSGAFGYGHIIGDGVGNYSGTGSFTYGNFNDNFGGGIAGGWGARLLNNGVGGISIALDGVPTIGGSTRDNSNYKWVIAAGDAINISKNTYSQGTNGQGALAPLSAIIGGQDHHIPSNSDRSIILGGNHITARSGETDQVYVPNLNIASTPALAGTNGTQILVRDSVTGQVGYATSVNASSFNGTAGWAVNANNAYALNLQPASYYTGFIIDDQATTLLKSYKSNVDIKGPGQVTMTNGSSTITGTGTAFSDTTTGTGFSYWQSFYVQDSAFNWYRVAATASNNTTASITNHYNRSDIRNGYTSNRGTTFAGVTGTYDYYIVRNWSDGLYSLALGNYSYADNYGFAFGGSTIATGSGATAIGYSAYSNGAQSFATGAYTRATGNSSFVGGLGVNHSLGQVPLASGQSSFAFYQADSSQTNGHGALAANSAILGGVNSNIPSNSSRSVVLGGNAIKARAGVTDMVYVPSLNISTTPNAGTAGDFLMRYASGATGDVSKVTPSADFSISGGIISVSNAAALNNQTASYYLSRANHTGTQTVSTISDLATNGTSGWALNALSIPTTIPNTTTFSANVAINGQAYVNQQTLTDASTINWNLNSGGNAIINFGTSGTSRLLANPTNMKVGGTYYLILKNNANGNASFSHGTSGSIYKYPSGITPVMTSTSNATDIITYISDGTYMYGVGQFNFA